MSLPLKDVLSDPSLAAAEPVLLAGEAGLSGLVRWVHTSEVFEIAGLLHGGELLLIGGVALQSATDTERRDYVRALSARGIAGLAIETGRRFPTVPDEMILAAEQAGLPLIELRKVVPFVDVTEAINGQLVNSSVRRLQLADQVSHALAAELADGGDCDALLDVLARQTDSDTVLVSVTGELIARCESDSPRSPSVLTASVTTAGVTVATLVLYPHITADPTMLDAARDRAPEALGLALLRSRPLSHLERDARELLSMAKNGTGTTRRYAELAGRLGLADDGRYVGVVARVGGHQERVRSLDEALRRNGRVVIGYLQDESYLAVVALPAGATRDRRSQLVNDLRAASFPPGLRVAVGPGSQELAGLERCLREAEVSLDIDVDTGGRTVIDAIDVSLERLIIALDRPDVIAAFIDEQLGDLLALDARKRGVMVQTLSTFLRHWGSKTETASAMHLQRQSLYQRLHQIFGALGEVPAGSARLGSIMIALELEVTRRRGSTSGQPQT